MKICVVGTGYVGLVAGVCFADAGHQVTCVDSDPSKIEKLKKNEIPIYEPGLQDILEHARSRLYFTTDLATSITQNSVIFVAVGTPETADGSADMRPTTSVIDDICKHANEKKYVVLKSTVPVGTAATMRERCRQKSKHSIEIISNPEFLKEGAAIDDFLKPDRIVIGCQSKDAETIMREVYEPFVKDVSIKDGGEEKILFMDNASAEMTKYAANAFLSIKISFINELALLADRVGADIDEVRRGFTSDSRINPAFFNPGLGFGGSCFPKDVKALVSSGQELGVPMAVVQAADEVNDRQKDVLFLKMQEFFADRGGLAGRTIAIWGLSFKPRTDDVREAASLHMIERLVHAGAKVQAYDPVARETARAASRVAYTTCDSAEEALRNADALAIVTEWNEFRTLDFSALARSLKAKALFDGRNIADPAKAAQAGLYYFCIGRQSLANRAGEEVWKQNTLASNSNTSSASVQSSTTGTSGVSHNISITNAPRKRALVAGGAGFIGSHLTELLLKKNYEVWVIDNLVTGQAQNIEQLQAALPAAAENLHFVRADLTQTLPLRIKQTKFDEIYNMASPASPIDFKTLPLFILKTSSTGHHQLLEIARTHHSRILFASSSEVYGEAQIHPQTESYFGNVNPIGERSCYDEAKRFGEALSVAHRREHGTQIRLARIFNTYGPRMRPDDGRIIPNFISQALANQPLTVYGDGQQTRSFCYVTDLVEGLYQLMQSEVNHPVNIGNPIEKSVMEMANLVCEIMGKQLKVQKKPLPENDPKLRRPDIQLAQKSLNWTPKVDLMTGLRHTIEYFSQDFQRSEAKETEAHLQTH